MSGSGRRAQSTVLLVTAIAEQAANNKSKLKDLIVLVGATAGSKAVRSRVPSVL